MAGDAYTGMRRRKQTPWSVRFGDALASRIIAIGGIGTIAAILLVVLVLVATALPLLNSPRFEAWHTVPSPQYQRVAVDANGLFFWGLTATGSIEVRSLLDGALLKNFPAADAGDAQMTCSTTTIDRSALAVGYSDGSFRVAEPVFESRLLDSQNLPPGIVLSQDNPVAVADGAVFQWLDSTGVRRSELTEMEWSDARQLGDQPVLSIDFLPDESSNRLSQNKQAYALAVVGKELVLASISTKRNMLTRKMVENLTIGRCALQIHSPDAQPMLSMLFGGRDQAVVVWRDGTLDRYASQGGELRFVETQNAFFGEDEITCTAPLLARETLLCGLRSGQLQGWMITAAGAGDSSVDGRQLSLAHEIRLGGDPLLSVCSSEQTHVAVSVDVQGQVSLSYITTDTLLSTVKAPLSAKIDSVSLDPNGSAVVATTADSLATAPFNIGHPEASFKSYFGKVWFEGHDYPKYIWQSSAGTEKSEIKLSLMPLVFGTLKATVYAMFISVPLAILAAIYTSEFMAPSLRARVKPVIELMASLPSVVLGYIAALVIAPYLQEHLLAVIVGLMCVPLSFVVAGSVWNLLPVDLMFRLQSWRLLAMAACLPLAIYLSVKIGGLCEDLLFEGNLIAWLGTREGSPAGGWLLLLIPALTCIVSAIVFGPMADFNRAKAAGQTPRGYALFSLFRLALVCVLVVFSAWAIAAVLAATGFDLRGNLFDSYQDRNALLVGGALGFCVIPIIYTISDDALQAVPASLRSASLGCGATAWQTTLRVVIPSAMSGLFSAVMIGLGRAVGETMVVLMAAGNTPLMEWNPFNGFRTLSATLATELPEAAKGSTHFRTLFLAALLLFLLTLVANTFAEFVRIRFRKRASQL